MAGNITVKYGTAANYTITLTSLASDTSLLAGRQSTTVVNSANADDYLVSGKVKCGTSPTTGTMIQIWSFADIDNAGTYQDAFTATDANRAVSFANLKPVEMKSVSTWVLDSGATTGSFMYFNNISLKSLYGYMPGNHGIWVVHNTGVALDASAGGTISYLPVFWQYA
jgi:hypothetical protein